MLEAISTGSSSNVLEGASLSMIWALPFAGMLLSLALMPIVAGSFWHHHFGKVSAFWGMLALGMMAQSFGSAVALHEMASTYLHHFFPFIIFILVLYVICGGIKIDVMSKATAFSNTLFLLMATFAASWIGTTGAAMLFIRPFLKVNAHRHNRVHLVIFFIFLVCNIGGCLTAIGDPPLFLGFLNGVDFFWPTIHLMGPYLTVAIPLLLIFYGVDLWTFRKDHPAGEVPRSSDGDTEKFMITLQGRRNVLFLLLAVGVIVASGIWKETAGLTLGNIHLTYPSLARDALLLILTALSLSVANQRVRRENHFDWAPFWEVFKVFAAIFITAAPVLAMLKAGEKGAFADLVHLVNTQSGPDNALYYWISGGLSAVLDNAPTYLVFFNIAGGEASSLMTTFSTTLVAISAGSVFMGAMTYIGNAPNFMVKSIAETHNIAMPSFFGYVLWSGVILLPLFYLVALFWL